MARHQSVSRRSALKTLGTAAAVATGATTAGAATTQQEASTPAETEAGRTVGREMTGLYSGTVDRVVDGEHVVILVESDGSVVGEHVVRKKEYPSLAEGDPVYLFILFGRVIAIWEAPGA
jgi:hypothetical protein